MAGLTRYWTSSSSVVSPNDQPALNAARFAFIDGGLALELLLDPALGDLGGAPVQPRQDPEREQVLGAAGVAGRGVLDLLDGARRQRGHRDPVHAVALERSVLERVGLVSGLLEVALRERVLVDDDRRAAVELREVGLQRRRVHRHQHVRRVAGGQDVARGEVDLERRDARERPGRGADLGREVRQRREVVAEHRGRVGEAAAGELHAVAGVAGEADHDPLALFDRLAHAFQALSLRLTRLPSVRGPRRC